MFRTIPAHFLSLVPRLLIPAQPVSVPVESQAWAGEMGRYPSVVAGLAESEHVNIIVRVILTKARNYGLIQC